MADETSLSLQGVLDRFSSSEATLQQLREKLRALALAEETSADAATSISRAASALDAVANELRELVIQAGSAQAEIQRAVTSAASFLAATDLGELDSRIETLAAASADQLARSAEQASATHELVEQQQVSMNEMATALASLPSVIERTVEERLSRLEGQLSELGELRRVESELRAQLDRVRSELPARKLKQIGLESTTN